MPLPQLYHIPCCIFDSFIPPQQCYTRSWLLVGCTCESSSHVSCNLDAQHSQTINFKALWIVSALTQLDYLLQPVPSPQSCCLALVTQYIPAISPDRQSQQIVTQVGQSELFGLCQPLFETHNEPNSRDIFNYALYISTVPACIELQLW
jgi:hypothetical protein